MKLPNSDKVIIPKEKLINYVLSETHSVGRFKAKYFRSLGFDENTLPLLEEVLRSIAKKEEIKNEIASQYGIKYILDGKIDSPIGKIVIVRTVWIIEKGQNIPRFVTVYPV